MFMVVGQAFSEVSEHSENNFVIVGIEGDIVLASQVGKLVDWKTKVRFPIKELNEGNTFCSYWFGSEKKLIFPDEDE